MFQGNWNKSLMEFCIPYISIVVCRVGNVVSTVKHKMCCRFESNMCREHTISCGVEGVRSNKQSGVTRLGYYSTNASSRVQYVRRAD